MRAVRDLLQRTGRLLGREEGSNAVETAISCTFLFAMLFGIFEMSLALYTYHYTSDAARQATRYAMVRGAMSCLNTPNLTNCNATGAEIQTWVRDLGYPGIKGAKVTVSTEWCAASATTPTTWSSCAASTANVPGNLVQVTVSYPMSFHIPFSYSPSFTLSSTSEMVISQ